MQLASCLALLFLASACHSFVLPAAPTTPEPDLKVVDVGEGFSNDQKDFFEMEFPGYFHEDGGKYTPVCHHLVLAFESQFGGHWGCLMHTDGKGAHYLHERNHVFAEYSYGKELIFVFELRI